MFCQDIARPDCMKAREQQKGFQVNVTKRKEDVMRERPSKGRRCVLVLVQPIKTEFCASHQIRVLI